MTNRKPLLANSEKTPAFDVIENNPGAIIKLKSMNIRVQSFGACSRRLIVEGAKILSIEPHDEEVVYKVPEDEADQSGKLSSLTTHESVVETVPCVVCHLDNGKQLQLSQKPLTVEDYRVVDGMLEWPADDVPHP